MSKYEKVQRMHQCYRDVFSREMTFPDCGKLPHEWIESILVSGSCDTVPIAEQLFTLDSGLPPNKDLALKLMLLVISQANLALERAREGRQERMPKTYIDAVRKGLLRVLKLDPTGHYAVIAVQLLYRLGEIDEMLAMVGRMPWLAEQSPAVQMILAMVFTVSGEHEAALPFLISLVEGRKQLQYPLISLMGMVCNYRLGELPDAPIDFSTLRPAPEAVPATAQALDWLLPAGPAPRTRPTVLIACDDRYFFDHALALIYSLHETNRGELLVHLHLYDPDPGVAALVRDLRDFLPALEISVTREARTWDEEGRRVHFCSQRFVVAGQLLQHFNAPLMVVDADCLFREKWSGWAAKHGLTGEVIFNANDFAPFWEQVLACFLYLQPTAAARHYIGGVARFISHNLAQGNHVWFLDQVALAACHDAALARVPAGVFQAGARLIDISHQADSLSWIVTTIKDADGDYAKYKSSLLEKYRQVPLTGPDDAFRGLGERQEQCAS